MQSITGTALKKIIIESAQNKLDDARIKYKISIAHQIRDVTDT